MIAKWQPKVHRVPRRVAINFSDPLGRGWNVFGSAEMGVNSAIFNHPTAIAVVQVCAIVGARVRRRVCTREGGCTAAAGSCSAVLCRLRDAARPHTRIGERRARFHIFDAALLIAFRIRQ